MLLEVCKAAGFSCLFHTDVWKEVTFGQRKFDAMCFIL